MDALYALNVPLNKAIERKQELARIFIIGASGYIGSATVRLFRACGHDVLGLSRGPKGDHILHKLGAQILSGDLASLGILADGARRSDAVIYAARFAPEEAAALQTLIEALQGTNRPLVFISGASLVAELTAGHASPRRFAEDSAPTLPKGTERRYQSEQIVRLAGASGSLRSMVVRPPLVYGNGGSVQIPMLARSAASSGAVRYVGPGENRWAFVHVDDLAALLAHAWIRGRAGDVYHAVAAEISFSLLANAIARSFGGIAASWSLKEAEEGYGRFPAHVMLGGSCRPTAGYTQATLGWQPKQTEILADIVEGSYKGVLGRLAR